MIKRIGLIALKLAQLSKLSTVAGFSHTHTKVITSNRQYMMPELFLMNTWSSILVTFKTCLSSNVYYCSPGSKIFKCKSFPYIVKHFLSTPNLREIKGSSKLRLQGRFWNIYFRGYFIVGKTFFPTTYQIQVATTKKKWVQENSFYKSN